MPSTRRRRRKSRKRKPSSRKKKFSSSRKRSRSSVSRPPANTLSSDEDFVLESGDEDSSFVSDGSVASSSDKDSEEEEHDEGEEDKIVEDFSVNFRNAANQRGSSRPRQRRRRRPKPDSSDEDFNVHFERASNDTESARERYENSRSARTRGRLGNSADDDDFVTDIGRNGFREGTSHPARVQHRRRKQDSSDEDFDVNIDKVLDITGRASEGAVATRSVTRAMDAGQVSDFVHLEGRLAGEDSKSNFKTGEAPFSIGNSSAREANSMDKDTAANKRKGKEKVVEGEELTGSLFAVEPVDAAGNEDGATAVVVCGICFNETAIVDRGKLDCCEHFFCFGCIMEWAKVESRCPMCKQRFTTVAKFGSGISKRTRTVRIPLRDQVYIPPEDDVPYEDPYADIICMECQGTGDEGLLLLCDRCDSAAHTFCVGLGRSVPRGDWYCRDCQALTGENSDSENEAEELVLASEDDEEEDDEFLLRSLVASENPPTRQRRVQRETVSTSRVPSRPRRRLGASERRRLWRRLLSRGRRGSSRRAATAPQLSQSARAFLSSITPELNPVSCLSEASQSGAARTVPQQRRLQERINALRNNWGRIQHGDIEFDAVRTQGLVNSTVSSSGTAPRGSSSTSAAGSAVDNIVDVDSAEPSWQGVKDLEQAWRMMGQARNLTAGTNSSPGQARNLVAGTVVSALHQQRPSLFHHVSKQSSQSRISQTTPSTILRTGALSCTSENIYRSTNAVRSTPLESTDASIKREPKEHQEDGITVSLALAARIGEDKKQGHPCSSSTATPLGFCMDSSRTSQLKGGSCAAVCAEKISVDGEKTALSQDSKPPMINLGRPSENISLGRTHNLTGDATNKEGASYAKESNEANPPNEGLKVHLIELVKKQTWPVYIAERLDKEQFKRIARAAVHALLDHCDPKNKSSSFCCSHFEDQGKSPVINCCRKCLDQHVEDAVRSAKDKIVPR